MTATEVDKIKRQAKRVKKATGIQHAAALEQAAREAGYSGWSHVVNLMKKEQPK